MGDAAGSKSIIVMLRYSPGSQFCSIVQLDTQLDSDPPPPPPRSWYDIKIADAKYLAHFTLQATPDFFATARISWLFAAPPTSTNDLYVVPLLRSLCSENVEVHGATFNCSTKKMKPIKPCIAFKPRRIPVTVGEDIFLLTHPIEADAANILPGIDRYIPAEDKWEKEARFPYRGIMGLGHYGCIEAYAVWNDIILLNMGGKQLWAYHVIKRKWYRVLVGDEKDPGINYDDEEEIVYKAREPEVDDFEVDENGNVVVKEEVEESEEEDSESEEEDSESEEDLPKEEDDDGKNDDVVDEDYEDEEDKKNDLCYAIIDEGFAVENYIYVLSNLSFSSILALSIEEKEKDAGGDLQFRCSLRSEFFVSDMTQIEDEDACFRSRRFLHLGEDNFCLVQSCELFDSLSHNSQPIQVTYLKLRGDEMVVTNILEHRLITDRFRGQFHLGLCFFKPEFKVTAIKKGETTFEFNPVTGSALEREEKTDFKPIMVTQDYNSSQTNVIDEQGHSVLVNLPLDPTVAQIVLARIVMELVKFGPITKFEEYKTEEEEEGVFAAVGFLSEDAKAQAIQASPINIDGYPVYVVELRTTAAKASVYTKIKIDGTRKGLSQILE